MYAALRMEQNVRGLHTDRQSMRSFDGEADAVRDEVPRVRACFAGEGLCAVEPGTQQLRAACCAKVE